MPHARVVLAGRAKSADDLRIGQADQAGRYEFGKLRAGDYEVCAFLPAIGLLAAFLPNLERAPSRTA